MELRVVSACRQHYLVAQYCACFEGTNITIFRDSIPCAVVHACYVSEENRCLNVFPDGNDNRLV
jgi:hypothetical protein